MKKTSPVNDFFELLLRQKTRPKFRADGLGAFHHFDFNFAGNTLSGKNSLFWEKQGEAMALKLFHEAARRVPAYKHFLKRNGIRPSIIKTIADFQKLPLTHKENYLRAFSLEELSWDGKLEQNTLFSVSSGSSGKPFLWPRGDNLELETAITQGLILTEILKADERSTLFVNSFSMGIYIAGVVIANSTLRSSEAGLPLTLISPGLEVYDAIKVIRELGPHYKQVIISGYPPFVKDIIDTGESVGMNWRRYNIKFLFAAENFSEEFRDYLYRKVGTPKSDAISSSVNIYGSADASILAHETPLSILLRQFALKNKKLHKELFVENPYVPTLAQYNPILKYFEEEEGELVFSTYGGIPLIRYNIHDNGRVLPFSAVENMVRQTRSAPLSALLRKSWKLPFVTVNGKSDLTISLYGVKIYPEHIRAGLEKKNIFKAVTGKFTMEQKNRKNHDPYWIIHVELRARTKNTKTVQQRIFASILSALLERSNEFGRLRAALGRRADPRIQLHLHGKDARFNPRAIKQRWVRSD